MIRYIEIKAPAKINVGLNITEKRPDGFHNLETLFYPLPDLFDKIIIERAEEYKLTCSDENLEIDDTNLITKAKIQMEQQFSLKINVNIHLEKRIPMGAGMGGGSSDAAAVILALNDMFGINASRKKLAEIALLLGSDVPYFLKPVPAVGKNRGELLKSVSFNFSGTLLVINPVIHINTGEAFRNITPQKPGYSYDEIFKSGNVSNEYLKNTLTNDFESFVFKKYPEIKKIKEMMYESGAEFSLMTGTGSTVFGVFGNKSSAETAADKFPGSYFKFIGEC